jgi:hypothetical protein
MPLISNAVTLSPEGAEYQQQTVNRTLPILLTLIQCLSGALLAQNAPVTTAGAVSTYGSTITVAITVTNFSNIGSCNLKLTYNPSIATATAVTAGSLPGGNLNSNLGVPGEIHLGWFAFPAVTLPDNSIIFYFDFTKVTTGTSPITWVDDGASCQYTDGNFNNLNDIPASAYYLNGSLSFLSANAPFTTAPVVSACPGTLVNIPVTVSAFNNIWSLNLKMQYNTAGLIYQSYVNNASFPALTVNGSTPGTVIVNGTVQEGGAPINLANNSVLLTLSFFSTGNGSYLNWFDDGTSCLYTGPPPSFQALNDLPQSDYYANGSVGSAMQPAIIGQPVSPNPVFPGTGHPFFKVSATGDGLSYQWQEFISNWNNIINGGIYGGALTDSLTITGPPVSMNGYRYRCTVTGDCNPPAISDGNATLVVDSLNGIGGTWPDNDSGKTTSHLMKLSANPNPFLNQVEFTFFLPEAGPAILEIFNMHGAAVASGKYLPFSRGNHRLVVNPGNLAPGVYMAVLILNTPGNLIMTKTKIIRK